MPSEGIGAALGNELDPAGLGTAWAGREELSQAVLALSRPALLISLFLAGWAADISTLDHFKIDYAAAIGLRQDELGKPRLFITAAVVLAFATTTLNIWALQNATDPSVLSLPVGVYALLLILLCAPLPPPLSRHLGVRKPLRRSLWRCLWQPNTRETPFIDILVADGLTSMARAFFDLGFGACVIYHTGGWPHMPGSSSPGTTWSPPDETPLGELSRSLLGLSLHTCSRSPWPYLCSAVPFLIRARQCMISAHWANDSYKRRVQYTNFAKYMSALPVVVLTFVLASSAGLDDAAGIEELWMLAALVNATFSMTWDLVFDWGLVQPAKRLLGVRPVLLLKPAVPTYVSFVAFNLVGRAMWSLRWSKECTALFPQACGSFQQCAEVARRCMWNVVRVEWECIKSGLNKCPSAGSECESPKGTHSHELEAAIELKDDSQSLSDKEGYRGPHAASAS